MFLYETQMCVTDTSSVTFLILRCNNRLAASWSYHTNSNRNPPLKTNLHTSTLFAQLYDLINILQIRPCLTSIILICKIVGKSCLYFLFAMIYFTDFLLDKLFQYCKKIKKNKKKVIV